MALTSDSTAAQTPAHDPHVVCAVYHQAIELIGKRWTGAIVSILFSGPVRFHTLVTAVPGMSERLCADRLRELEVAGLVSRHVLPGPPVGVEYELTEAGRDLQESLNALGAWAHRWLKPGTTGSTASIRLNRPPMPA